MYRIIIIVDEAFGSRLLDFAREAYVWIIESGENQTWIKQAWAAETSEEDPIKIGVSCFTKYPDESSEDLLIRVIDMVDEHHGDYAHDPPWSVLEVHGARLTAKLTTELRNYGVDRIEESEDGFLASRKVSRIAKAAGELSS